MGRKSTISPFITAWIESRVRNKGGKKLTTEKLFKELTKKLNEIQKPLPGRAAFDKEVARARKQVNDTPPNELDQPWSIGSTKEHHILPEVIPLLIEEQRKMRGSHDLVLRDDEGQPVTFQVGTRIISGTVEVDNTLTIREALWWGRLYPAVANLVKRKVGAKESMQSISENMTFIASYYAWKEQAAEHMHKPYPETGDLDQFLFTENTLNLDELISLAFYVAQGMPLEEVEEIRKGANLMKTRSAGGQDER